MMLISQYIRCNRFKDFNEKLVEKLIWLGAKMGFRAVKRKHGGMLLMVSRKKIKSNYEKILNNHLDHSVGRYVFTPEVEKLIIHHGTEDGAIIIDRKGKLIENNCALPLNFKGQNSEKKIHPGVRRATAVNVTKRFKALAMIIRSNGLVTIVYHGKIRGIIKFTETDGGRIVPLVDNVSLSYFPDISSFSPKLKSKVRLMQTKKLIKGMQPPYATRLDYFKDRCPTDGDWELQLLHHQNDDPKPYTLARLMFEKLESYNSGIQYCTQQNQLPPLKNPSGYPQQLYETITNPSRYDSLSFLINLINDFNSYNNVGMTGNANPRYGSQSFPQSAIHSVPHPVHHSVPHPGYHPVPPSIPLPFRHLPESPSDNKEKWSQKVKKLKKGTREKQRISKFQEMDPNEDIQSDRKMTIKDFKESGLIGIWKDRTDIDDSLEFSRQLRKKAQRRGSI